MSTNYIDQITDTAGTTHDISEGDSTRIFRATCTTAAGTAAKVATLNTSNKNFSLTAGVRVAVTFTYGNSAATPTLRVDGSATGTAKNIAIPTAVATVTSGNGTTYNTWGPRETIIFTYDGTNWVQSGSGLSLYNAYALAASKSSFSGSYNDLSDKPTIPTIPSNNVTGSGTSGYLTKWNGTNAITNGPQLGSSTTTYLRNDGTWATPAYPVTSVNTKTGAISLTAADIGIKFGYTTSGNNRAVQQDSSGNLYVTQKDDNSDTKATQTLTTSGQYRVLLTYTGKNSDTENSVTNVTRRADTLWYDCDAYTLHNNVCNWSSKTSTTANTAAYSTLVLGNEKAVSTTSAHSQGVLSLYSDNTSYGELKQASVTSSVTHTLPATGGTILNTGTTSFTQSLTSGTTIGTIKINGSSTTLYAPTNTDTKVTQAYSTASSSYPILMTATAGVTSTGSRGDTTTILNNGLYYIPSSGTLKAGNIVKIYNWTWDAVSTTGHLTLSYTT